jgi:hypothetical protein
MYDFAIAPFRISIYTRKIFFIIVWEKEVSFPDPWPIQPVTIADGGGGGGADRRIKSDVRGFKSLMFVIYVLYCTVLPAM